ncbi:phiSA1p31-related protein [Streptomyces cyaneofuscatus]|uniref:phiSA1p31-related protein n=1 Tax=Streptomyces cyaneofuscatus TaxID=66883 RepID=UPI0033B760D9
MTTHLLTTWRLDGVEIDLTRTHTDMFDGEWDYVGVNTTAGEPLMQRDGRLPIPLSVVYATYGPLIPSPRMVTRAAAYAVLTACAADTTDEEKEPPAPSTFAVLLGRLRRRKDTGTTGESTPAPVTARP